MTDKRKLYAILNEARELQPENKELIDSISAGVDEIPAITDREKKALKMYPVQFVKRIAEEDGEWTTKLHLWAEHGVKEILDLDPIYLGFKNSYGDTVLMCVAIAATGTYTGTPDYDLARKMFSRDYTYEEPSVGSEKTVEKNAMGETDIEGKTPIDYIRDVAFATGEYEGEEPDLKLQMIVSASPEDLVDPEFSIEPGPVTPETVSDVFNNAKLQPLEQISDQVVEVTE